MYVQSLSKLAILELIVKKKTSLLWSSLSYEQNTKAGIALYSLEHSNGRMRIILILASGQRLHRIDHELGNPAAKNNQDRRIPLLLSKHFKLKIFTSLYIVFWSIFSHAPTLPSQCK